MKPRAGVALLLVLWIIVVLSTIAAAVAQATRATNGVAVNYRARVIARYAAESGLTAAVAALEDSLARMESSSARQAYLNQLERALGARQQLDLEAARAAVALIDVGARLDVNNASTTALTTLFSFFTDALQAESAARAIQAYITRGQTAQDLDPAVFPDPSSQGLLVSARPLQSLDELLHIPGMPPALAQRAVPYLTVDGDGTINRATASDTVLAAAAGGLRDEPSRILVVSRGWQDGSALTHEIQAVYALNGNVLTLVRWRERDL
jgi:general secretion pathway protein K